MRIPHIPTYNNKNSDSIIYYHNFSPNNVIPQSITHLKFKINFSG